MSNVNFMQAAGAYQDAMRVAQQILSKTGSSSGPEETQNARAGSFIDLVGQALSGAAASGYKSESMATRALSGKADLTDVVTAVSEAETALNTVVAIRDRVINAYQEIIKMPI